MRVLMSVVGVCRCNCVLGTSTCVYVCVYVPVCVWERERER